MGNKIPIASPNNKEAMPEGGDGKKDVPCGEEWPKEAKKSAAELPSLSVWDRRQNSNEATRALMSRIKAVAKPFGRHLA
ncbi:hypothetical protein SLA2020_251460 [Shorea laevis]